MSGTASPETINGPSAQRVSSTSRPQSATPGTLPSPDTSRRNSHSEPQKPTLPVPPLNLTARLTSAAPPPSTGPPSTVLGHSFHLPHPSSSRHSQPMSNGHMTAREPMPSSGPLAHLLEPQINQQPGGSLPKQPQPSPPQSAASTVSFPSPRVNADLLSRSGQYAEISSVIQRSDPQIVRQVVRDLHQTCLLGSEYHFAFMINTAFHKASVATLAQSVSDFGERMARSSKRSILSFLTADDLDEVSDLILSKVNNSFLDQALSKRLETIRARSLVNALARAERLGYDVKDLVEERRDGTERVVPHSQRDLAQHPQHQPHPAQPPQLPHHGQQYQNHPQHMPPAPPKAYIQHPPLADVIPPGESDFIRCRTCTRPCSGPHALKYHNLRNVCAHMGTFERVGKDICPHCGAEFTSAGGLKYHMHSQVCGSYTEKTALAIVPALQHFYQRHGHHITQGAHMMANHPGGTHYAQQVKFKPVNMVSTPESANTSPVVSPKLNDPYAKLTPDERQRFDAEMKQAEERYGEAMRRAMDLPQPKRDDELARLKNSYNTKQSVTRKKYGIRLRERRPKAVVEAERSRLLGNAMPTSNPTYLPPSPAQVESRPTGYDAMEPPSKRSRSNIEGDSHPTAVADHHDDLSDDASRKLSNSSAGSAVHVSGPQSPLPTPTQSVPEPESDTNTKASRESTDRAEPAESIAAATDDAMVLDEIAVEESVSENEDDDIPAKLPSEK